LNSDSVIYDVKKYVASSANWKKKIELEEQLSLEDTIFEAMTRAVEWALNSGKEIGIFTSLRDPDLGDKEYISLSYKVLSNAGQHILAELQRQMVKEDFNIDIAQGPVEKIVIKLQKASLKKAYCISKYFDIQIENRVSKVAIVCFQLGLFETKEEAQLKCKELNKANSGKEKLFIVKKFMYNE